MVHDSFLPVRILTVFFRGRSEGEIDCKGKACIVDDAVEPIDGIACFKEVYSIYMYGYHAYQHCHTEEELDFIINYDIKYRMGDELNDD